MTLRILAATAALLAATIAAAAPAPPDSKTRVMAKRYQFVLCRKGEDSFLGDWEWWRYGGHQVQALARAPHPNFLLVRRDEGLFIITDAVIVRAALVLLVPVEDLGRRQDELGRQQAALGQRQAKLGERQVEASTPTQQTELGRQQTELGRQQSELGRRQSELGQRQGELGRQQVAAMAKAAEQLIPVFDAAFTQGKTRPVAGG